MLGSGHPRRWHRPAPLLHRTLPNHLKKVTFRDLLGLMGQFRPPHLLSFFSLVCQNGTNFRPRHGMRIRSGDIFFERDKTPRQEKSLFFYRLSIERLHNTLSKAKILLLTPKAYHIMKNKSSEISRKIKIFFRILINGSIYIYFNISIKTINL